MEKRRTEYLRQVKQSGVLSSKLLKCFEYILKFGPLTANELIDKIVKLEGDSEDAYTTMSWNKLPSILLEHKVVEVIGKRKCSSNLTKSDSEVKVWDVTFAKPQPIRKFSKKVESLLLQSQHSALLAVEIYNKPTTKFKSEGFITLMMISWTKALHAYFLFSGIDFFQKDKSGVYVRNEDNEKKTWDLSSCIQKYGQFSEAVKKNLEINIKIRNRIVHGSVEPSIFDPFFFPECQSLLYNLENFLKNNFGDAFSINHSLAYSLQFSAFRSDEQLKSLHQLSTVKEGKILEYLDLFRNQLKDEVYNSPEYGIRLISVPQVHNSGRRGTPVEFINWDNLDDYQKENLSKINAIIKTKKEIQQVSNVGKVKAKDIVKKVTELTSETFHLYNFQCFCFVYSIRPYDSEKKNKMEFNGKYCAFDELHSDYIYEPSLADLIARALISKRETISNLKLKFKNKEKEDLSRLIQGILNRIES